MCPDRLCSLTFCIMVSGPAVEPHILYHGVWTGSGASPVSWCPDRQWSLTFCIMVSGPAVGPHLLHRRIQRGLLHNNQDPPPRGAASIAQT